MKTNKRIVLVVLAAAIAIAAPSRAAAQNSAAKSSANAPLWSVQVAKVDPGDVALAESFQIAIYENLLDELNKTKHFQQVLRDGNRKAADVGNLLILKTTVQKYSAGSETKRAVTTVSGATKLTVHSQLCTRDGQVILDRTINGNVRFLGSNLRATHNLARNVAHDIKDAPLPEPSTPAPQKTGGSDKSGE